MVDRQSPPPPPIQTTSLLEVRILLIGGKLKKGVGVVLPLMPLVNSIFIFALLLRLHFLGKLHVDNFIFDVQN